MLWPLFVIQVLLCTAWSAAQNTDEFRDDFNGDRLDLAKWVLSNSQQLEYYKVGNGFLTIKPGADAGTRLTTLNKYSFRYGEVEWRAKIAGAGGSTVLGIFSDRNSTEPGCSKNLVGEYYVARGRPEWLTVGANALGEESKYKCENPGLSADFHLFKAINTPNSLTFFVDNKEVLRLTHPELLPKCPLYLFMLAGGSPSAPSTIDYVKVQRGWSETYDV